MDERLLVALACPRCESRPPLEERDEALVCTLCRWSFPVVDGVPHLIAEEAVPPEGKDD